MFGLFFISLYTVPTITHFSCLVISASGLISKLGHFFAHTGRRCFFIEISLSAGSCNRAIAKEERNEDAFLKKKHSNSIPSVPVSFQPGKRDELCYSFGKDIITISYDFEAVQPFIF
ncbi:hypothetical protein BpHYR1_001695 [Brachionus plicatilis]|uniref:Uncharacterized protein n=1 Tax=Brachionus plicatilis TaxID=10195 RepID=A0A3M7T0B2_BRAPC|nr:hypothetical protein BpHYR1_001695 [Brachionus plicatilis]